MIYIHDESTGATARIVTACVVVVITVAALLVHFVVFTNKWHHSLKEGEK